jgi:addiction module HigA family antidote
MIDAGIEIVSKRTSCLTTRLGRHTVAEFSQDQLYRNACGTNDRFAIHDVQVYFDALSLDIGVPSGRITDILNGRRAITADTAVRLGRYFGNSAPFWLDLQGQYDIGVVEREKGAETTRRVRPADAA